MDMDESPVCDVNDWPVNSKMTKDNLLYMYKEKERSVGLKFDEIAAKLFNVRRQSKGMEELKTLKQIKLDFQIAETKSLAMQHKYLQAKINKERNVIFKDTVDDLIISHVTKENTVIDENLLRVLKARIQVIENEIRSAEREHEAVRRELECLRINADDYMN